ncbi:MAG TPA: acylphosphatase [Gemmataceae bacterium]|nr:acylphosphatase [Gemmataceae bacterium]
MPHLTMVVLLLSTGVCTADPPTQPAKASMVYYSGNVQGVGFRATAVEIAKDYPVTGWVKNLSDGRVQLLAEGSADAVDRFLKAVRTHWDPNIEKEEIESQTPTGKYKTFEIAR